MAPRYRRIAVIGAGPSGLAAVRELEREQCFDCIRVFERKDRVGGIWAYEPEPDKFQPSYPAAETQTPIPDTLPALEPPIGKRAGLGSPVYDGLDTNAGARTMAFTHTPIPFANSRASEVKFGKGNSSRTRQAVLAYLEDLFVPYLHWVAFNTAVERMEKIGNQWVLTLRQSDLTHAGDTFDYWYEERFDAVVVASGHHTVPFTPDIAGLEEVAAIRPDKLLHSKSWRRASDFAGQRVIIMGNNVSAADLVDDLHAVVKGPLYISQKEPNAFFEHAWALPNVVQKPVIVRLSVEDDGTVYFADGTCVHGFDRIIFATGYKLSYPYLPFDAVTPQNRLSGFYQHIFRIGDPSLTVIGQVSCIPPAGILPGLMLTSRQVRAAITFRIFEYQSWAVARYFAGRSKELPSNAEQEEWEASRLKYKGPSELFHEIKPDFTEYYGWLRDLAKGDGDSSDETALPEFQADWVDSDLEILFAKSRYWRDLRIKY
ncbi:FAD/NAD(P)-binding domain-containing protein [Aspergillus carlsbadensis]|nr:FAD/NAD(P)-binding domain-containing protein [Aspergillus carlsbadensis]